MVDLMVRCVICDVKKHTALGNRVNSKEKFFCRECIYFLELDIRFLYPSEELRSIDPVVLSEYNKKRYQVKMERIKNGKM